MLSIVTWAWAYLDKDMHDDAVNELIAGMRVQGTSEAALARFEASLRRLRAEGYWRRWLEMEKHRIENRRFFLRSIWRAYTLVWVKVSRFCATAVAYEDKSSC